jgi:hypothetical protein
MNRFLDALKEQRWDDHRFYHHSRINQSLHLVSALSFLVTYVLLFTQPVAAALFGWMFAMCIRQVGHFFFEPKGYDEENQATHAYKEQVKVGYNLRRKIILHAIWGATPLVLLLQPSFFGLFTPHTNLSEFLQHLSKIWIALGVGALLFRTIHLFFLRDVMTGVVWFTKILTDLLRGELVEPPKQHA